MGINQLNELICAQTAMDAPFDLLVQKERTQKGISVSMKNQKQSQ